MRQLILSISLMISFSALAQNYKSDIYKAFVNGDMKQWERILTRMESDYKNTKDYKLLENIVEVEYGLIGYLIGADKKRDAEPFLEKALDNLDVLMARNDKVARYWAYKSAFTGFKIGIAPYKAPFLGGKSFDYIDQAMTLDNNNPYVLVEFANGRYYAPGFAGGDKKVARNSFKKAIELLEADSLNLVESWYYLMWKTNHANMLLDEGKRQEALKAYDEILEFEPNYSWVRDELKPKAQETK